ncbi:hypothetical protein [Streptosporangium sp. NPDC002524]|uniref:hypothetical protein n=1 Tax=Streptosporangium sp. NPDC002524 TaxID=3154537 RepID=UPI0033322C22
MNALEVSRQQQDDARKQRIEDKKEADIKERSAFVKNITVRFDNSPSGKGRFWSLRNANSLPVSLYLKIQQDHKLQNIVLDLQTSDQGDTPRKAKEFRTIYHVILEPCTQGVVRYADSIPPSDAYSWEMLASFEEADGGHWPIAQFKKNGPQDLFKWAGKIPFVINQLKLTKVKKITPCG